jgi:HEAT repeat protein
LRYPNHFYRERAADALGKLHIEPKKVVPALTLLLQDTSPAARYLAISGLGNFGTEARSAVPDITPFLESSDEGLRKAATDALRKIAPEVLTNASRPAPVGK